MIQSKPSVDFKVKIILREKKGRKKIVSIIFNALKGHLELVLRDLVPREEHL